MLDFFSQLFAGGTESDFWAAFMVLGGVVATIAIIAITAETWTYNLAYSVLVSLNDSKNSLEIQSTYTTKLMGLYKLRAMSRSKLNEASLRKAQATSEEAEPGTFEFQTLSEALGGWVATGFSKTKNLRIRSELLDGVAELLREVQARDQNQRAPAGVIPIVPLATPPAELPPSGTANED